MKTYAQIAVLLVFGCNGTLPPEGLVADGGDGDGGADDGDPNGIGHPDGWDPGQRSDGGPMREGGAGGMGGAGSGAGEDAGGAGGADAAPTGDGPWFGPCDPYTQAGCGPGEACDRACSTGSGRACRAIGTGTVDAPCAVVGDSACAQGYSCISFTSAGVTTYKCKKVCATKADCPSGTLACNHASICTGINYCAP